MQNINACKWLLRSCSPEWLTMRITWYISLLTATGRTSATRAVHTLKKTPASVNHCINFVQSFIIDFAVDVYSWKYGAVRAIWDSAPTVFLEFTDVYGDCQRGARFVLCGRYLSISVFS